jgi:hypothetical protein
VKPHEDRDPLRRRLPTNGASPTAAAWRFGDRAAPLPTHPNDLVQSAGAQQERAQNAAEPDSPAPSLAKKTMNHDLERDLNSKQTPTDTPVVSIRTWTRGSVEDERSGLLGFLSLTYGDFVFDSVAVRRTADGRVALSWPERRDRSGRGHPYLRPANDEARKRIEKVIFGQAVAKGVAW